MATGGTETAAGKANVAGSVLAGYIAADPTSRKLLEQVRKVAESATTVLIRGENGTGKDHLAAVLHYLGPNSDEPLLKIDCASLPHELVESELFGYEKGAFTGATHQKRGRLELAGTGTIVLDEVAALTLPVQAKLLRVIEQKQFERLGGERTHRVQARLVALTNVDLEQAVARHAFREDLYYRLSVIPLTVPPLRDRLADIPPLINHFLAQLSEMQRRPRPSISAAVLRVLTTFSYPGNVRQLRNILERALVLSTSREIGEEDLPAFVRQAGTQKMMSLEELERSYIAEVLDHTRGRKSHAAAILGISRKTLLEKRKKYGLD